MPFVKTLRAAIFRPTTSMSGNESPSVFRGENMMLRGSNNAPYFEVFGGNKDLGENFNIDTSNYKLSGLISWTANSDVISGDGDAEFINELHIGQFILAGTEVFSVKEIIDIDSFRVYRPPTTNGTNQIARRLPQISNVEQKRCVMLSGNVIQFEQGHYIGVGSGEVYINGQVLPGESLIASNRPKAAIYRPSTNDYKIVELGFDSVPIAPEINVITGGTKGMTDKNKYSFMVSFWTGTPEGTNGFSNPCEVIKQDGSSQPIQIDGADNLFEFDFTATVGGTVPDNALGVIIWGSRGGQKTVSTSGATTTTTSTNETNYENGPWYEVKRILFADLDGDNKCTLEYLDAEMGAEVTGDNDAPPDAEFVAKEEGKPLYISCFGKRRDGGRPEGSNPGPSVSPSKYSNPDAAPVEWKASIKNSIIGFFEGVGRWFLMTASSLDFAVSTGLLGRSIQGASQDLQIPVITRPYWKTGAANRYSTCIIDDTIYGFSGKKIFRSVGQGDENVKKYEFGGPVKDIIQKWNDGYVFTEGDGKNNNVCFIYSAAYKNDAGYWCSVLLPFALDSSVDAWMPLIVFSDDTRDCIISGVTVINERLHFLMGGRKADSTFQMKTYQFDEEDLSNPVSSMPYYILWQIADDGVEDLCKQIHSLRIEGKFTDPKVQIYGVSVGGELIIEDMERGINSLSGNISFPDSSEITVYNRIKMKFKNLSEYAVRFSGNWDGTGKKDRLDELEVEVSTHGKRR